MLHHMDTIVESLRMWCGGGLGDDLLAGIQLFTWPTSFNMTFIECREFFLQLLFFLLLLKFGLSL